MHLLFRIIIGASFVWLICHYFYSLGRKSALNGSKEKTENNNRRKTVESRVTDKGRQTNKEV